jgi:hypothetical protein
MANRPLALLFFPANVHFILSRLHSQRIPPSEWGKFINTITQKE